MKTISRAHHTAATRIALAALVTLLALAALPAAPSRADDSVAGRKIRRQISVFEQIFNQVLVESPNFMVHLGENTRGIYLAEFGVVFSFEASLIQKDGSEGIISIPSFKFEDKGDSWVIWDGKKKRTIRKDGATDIIEGREDEEAPEAPEPPDMSDEDNPDEDYEPSPEALKELHNLDKLRERAKNKEKRLYERGKQEIIDTLLEYGDTLTGLRDDQWIAAVAFLKDSEYFQDSKISRLILKAKMGDIRAYTGGQLSETAVAAKIVQEEY